MGSSSRLVTDVGMTGEQNPTGGSIPANMTALYGCPDCGEGFTDATTAALHCVKKVFGCECGEQHETKAEAKACCPPEIKSGYPCPECGTIHETKAQVKGCCDLTAYADEPFFVCSDCGEEETTEEEARDHGCEEA